MLVMWVVPKHNRCTCEEKGTLVRIQTSLYYQCEAPLERVLSKDERRQSTERGLLSPALNTEGDPGQPGFDLQES